MDNSTFFLDEVFNYIKNKRKIKNMKPIALECLSFGTCIFYYYNNEAIEMYKDNILLNVYLSNIFNKYFINKRAILYVCKDIVSKRVSIINKVTNENIFGNVYATDNKNILYTTVKSSSLYLDDNVEIDYTNDNFNIIDEI